ncbi:unnamed protein product, partial [Dovyalis caffra]
DLSDRDLLGKTHEAVGFIVEPLKIEVKKWRKRVKSTDDITEGSCILLRKKTEE